MKKILTLFLMSTALFVNAQAFKGKGDTKLDIGANLQDGGSGIRVGADFGVAENISFGFVTSYLLGVAKIDGVKPDFEDRIDLKARLNANLNTVLNLGPNVDIYPGLDLSLKNFGGHIGGRYFFSEGIGLVTEIGFPIAKYDPTTTEDFQNLNNQFVFNIGFSFNL
ncbi:DUF6646 family protein [Flavobacterium algicola]|uniref:DUF6646 family protein n=1 Tax=Flavobacterium algicola TaxID=556529 RepID=UPI001EFCAEE2|nr:DUF6646 family protein [Flavobacterium algicola]MCG9791840.1 hypothetical protein [Flavobacterium algicola]